MSDAWHGDPLEDLENQLEDLCVLCGDCPGCPQCIPFRSVERVMGLVQEHVPGIAGADQLRCSCAKIGWNKPEIPGLP